MRDWAASHPKAKLMAVKRAAILEAARNIFLRCGYEGTSMEAIAAAAGVSIMTLYRHAENKQDLFAAVIAGDCDPSDEAEMAEMAEMMKKPLHDVLVMSGMMFQQRLASPDTVALLRAVMAESSRFPELAETAYRGLVGQMEGMVEWILGGKDEAKNLDEAARQRLSAAFIDRLFGADMLRILLGIGGASAAQHHQRAERAAADTVATIAAGRAKVQAG
jgi:TetR/AcrR family transcriptional repressor of mexJK operon